MVESTPKAGEMPFEKAGAQCAPYPTYRLIAPYNYNYRRAALPGRVGDREGRDSEIAPTDKPNKTIV